MLYFDLAVDDRHSDDEDGDDDDDDDDAFVSLAHRLTPAPVIGRTSHLLISLVCLLGVHPQAVCKSIVRGFSVAVSSLTMRLPKSRFRKPPRDSTDDGKP
jgi:hypothetical protein